MGANAQIAVPVFTAGQTLTALQQTQINTGIPVFSNTTTRNAAFGSAGEKTLAEGQFAYLEDTNTTQYYDGAAWQSVGTTPGMVYITGASFSAVTTLSMAAGVFTSTYKNYMVILDVTSASTDYDLDIRVNNAGTPRTASNYYGATFFINNVGSSVSDGTNAGALLNNFMRGSSGGGGATIMVYDPTNASSNTAVTTIHGSRYFSTSGGQYLVNEANDGLTFLTSSAVTITGFYRVYGLSEA
jgi:hypothetical protein